MLELEDVKNTPSRLPASSKLKPAEVGGSNKTLNYKQHVCFSAEHI